MNIYFYEYIISISTKLIFNKNNQSPKFGNNKHKMQYFCDAKKRKIFCTIQRNEENKKVI